jgi:CRISPR-associated protein Cmr3
VDAVWLAGQPEVRRTEPVPAVVPTLGRDDDDAREALWRSGLEVADKPLAPPRWWCDEDFTAWLAGHRVLVRTRDATLALARRFQAHVRIRAEELTADEGALFSHDVVETLEPGGEWAMCAEVDLPKGEAPNLATLGSDSRLARVEPVPDSLFGPPAPVLETFRAGTPGLRVLTVTPALFERGWLPDGLERSERSYRGPLPGLEGEVVLRAAFVSRPVHVSGWDMAAGRPKPTSRMVPAGSVYFFERVDKAPFDESDANRLWLSALGSRTAEGFGRVVPGAWHPTRSNR